MCVVRARGAHLLRHQPAVEKCKCLRVYPKNVHQPWPLALKCRSHAEGGHGTGGVSYKLACGKLGHAAAFRPKLSQTPDNNNRFLQSPKIPDATLPTGASVPTLPTRPLLPTLPTRADVAPGGKASGFGTDTHNTWHALHKLIHVRYKS